MVGRRIIVWLAMLGLGFIGGVLISSSSSQEIITGADIQSIVVAMRDKGIKEAEAKGDYRCCIKPACTMCYMEANQWNGFEAGTCKCDDLIAKGEEPCPQCNGSACKVELD